MGRMVGVAGAWWRCGSVCFGEPRIRCVCRGTEVCPGRAWQIYFGWWEEENGETGGLLLQMTRWMGFDTRGGRGGVAQVEQPCQQGRLCGGRWLLTAGGRFPVTSLLEFICLSVFDLPVESLPS